MFEVFLLGVALAMDSLTVSIANGIRYRNYHRKEMILSSITFGLFQGGMPLIGAFLFLRFMEFIERYDHWVVFIVLLILGGQMIHESFKPEEIREKSADFSTKILLAEGVATSIDALSAGVSLPFLPVNIWVSALTITLVTTAICLLGHLAGKKIGLFLKDKAVFIGGLILILIGLKTLLEHTGVL